MRNPGNFGLWNPESTALESGIQLMDPESNHNCNPEFRLLVMESRIHRCGIRNPQTWNPESKTLLDYRINSNKRRGAYLIFRATSAALI